MCHGCEVDVGNRTPRTAHQLALRLGPGHAGSHTLYDSRLLELSQRTRDVKLQSACWRCGIDSLTEADKSDAESGQFLRQRHKVPEVPAQPVEPPHEQYVGGHADIEGQ
jgi:hypothetical protein